MLRILSVADYLLLRTLQLNFGKIASFFVPVMDFNEKKLERRRLFNSLQEAKEESEKLFNKIEKIKADIVKLENLEAFESFRDDRVDGNTETLIVDYPAPKKRKIDEFSNNDGYVIVYTDGACEFNGYPNAKAGIGVWFGPNHPCNVSKPVNGKATNNAAEIQACIAAVQIAKDNSINKLKIITDSQFVINSMTKWIKGWKKKGWKVASGKSDVKNKTDFQVLDNLCNGVDIQWEYVEAHCGHEGNEQADALAKSGAKLYKCS